VAALAAGLALGTKFTLILPVVALTVGIWVLARRGRRLVETGTWVLLVLITGGFWYLRNLIAVGNPLPSLALHLGPLALPSPAIGTPSSTLAHYLAKGSAWHKYFLPGLRLSFGPAWWAILALAAAGLILGVMVGPHRMPKMLAWVGLASGAAFVVTPQYLAVLGTPVYFVDNVRYVDPALVLGLVLLPLIPWIRERSRQWWLLGIYAAILAVTQFDGTLWPIHLLTQRFADPIGGVDSVIGLLIGLLVLIVGSLVALRRRGEPRWRPHLLIVALVGIALVVSGFSLQQFYMRNRYTNSNPSAIFSWAQNISNARIAVAGNFTQIQYELYGRNLTNYVQYVAQPEPHGGYAPITSCRRWRQALNSGHYDYVVTATSFNPDRQSVFKTPSSYTAWTGTDPASSLIRRQTLKIAINVSSTEYVGTSLFRLHGRLDPSTCTSAAVEHVVPRQS
jgi:hypothetical protein